MSVMIRSPRLHPGDRTGTVRKPHFHYEELAEDRMGWASDVAKDPRPADQLGRFLRKDLLGIRLAFTRSELKPEARRLLRKFDWFLTSSKAVHGFERRNKFVDASYTCLELMYGEYHVPENPDEKRRKDPAVRIIASYMEWAIKNEILPREDLGHYREHVEEHFRLIRSFLS